MKETSISEKAKKLKMRQHLQSEVSGCSVSIPDFKNKPYQVV